MLKDFSCLTPIRGVEIKMRFSRRFGALNAFFMWSEV